MGRRVTTASSRPALTSQIELTLTTLRHKLGCHPAVLNGINLCAVSLSVDSAFFTTAPCLVLFSVRTAGTR